MMEEEVTYSNNEWTYGGTIFWPATEVDFYSVSPSDVAGVDITNEKQVIKGFTVNEDQSKQIDLLYAVNKGETKADHEATPVSINFRHALSQIVFKAKNTNENLKVIIKGVKIGNIKKAGNFTYPEETTKGPVDASGNIKEEDDDKEQTTTITSDTQGEWEAQNIRVTFSAGVKELTLDGVKDAEDLTTTENGVYTGALFMIPQDLTAWDPATTGALNTSNTGVYFLLNCQILSGTNKNVTVWPTTEADDDSDGYAEIAIPASNLDKWEQGKKYIYTFIFGEGAGYEPGDKPDPKPTLVGIDFDVTVDEFMNGAGQEIDMETGKEHKQEQGN